MSDAPNKPGSLRQSMAWLHTWGGLWCAWLLFAIFFTGTLAVFEEPISHWMNPEHALAEAAGNHGAEQGAEAAALAQRGQRLQLGADYMARTKADADLWEIWPVDRGAAYGLNAYWIEEDGRYGAMALDPHSGAPLDAVRGAGGRATAGGHHFVDFHYQLHSGRLGLWIVGFAAMGMLVALVSGILIHKRIFKDFFTFRPARGQRSWLDAHNALAVLTIPFQCMIAYTGLAISGAILMPAPVAALYGTDALAARRFDQALTQPGKPQRSGVTMDMPGLEPYAARAEAQLGQQVRAVVIDHPRDRAMRICVYGWNEAHEQRDRLDASTGMMCFAAAAGAGVGSDVLELRMPGQTAGAAPRTRQVMAALHMATFGGLTVKWLYFACGLAGAAMIATGAILFMVKRRQRHGAEFGAATARVYRLIEGVNVGAIAGLSLACIGYLWANRLIPAALQQRADWEVRAFFAIWLLALGHALLRPAARVWREQLGALAVLCLLLPLLGSVTSGDSLWSQIGRGDWESAGVELGAIGFAALAGVALRRTRAA